MGSKLAGRYPLIRTLASRLDSTVTSSGLSRSDLSQARHQKPPDLAVNETYGVRAATNGHYFV